MNEKLCTRCKEVKPLSDFGTDNRHNKPKAVCRKCDREIHRLRYAAPLTAEERQKRAVTMHLRYKKCYEAKRAAGICTFCSEPAESGFTVCSTHRAKALEKEAKRRVKLYKNHLCTRCGVETVTGSRTCEKCRSSKKEGIVPRYTTKTFRDRREYARKRMCALRDECYSVYGNKCACCGETEQMFFNIDHVNNDGAAHRHTMFTTRWYGVIYGWLKRNGFPPEFQLLCANCNQGKQRNGGICPHKTKEITNEMHTLQ